jgi:hypothetical protein
MGRHSVVSSNEIVIISRCPACDGMVFCCLERFMQEEDRGLLDDLADRGYWIDSFSLSRCRAEVDAAAVVLQPRRWSKRLPRRRAGPPVRHRATRTPGGQCPFCGVSRRARADEAFSSQVLPALLH